MRWCARPALLLVVAGALLAGPWTTTVDGVSTGDDLGHDVRPAPRVVGTGERLIVTLEQWPPAPGVRTALRDHAPSTLGAFAAAGALELASDAGVGERIAALPFVAGVAVDEPLEALLDSSREAVNIRPSLREAGVDGSGVAIALVDSGIDDTHPALRDRVVANLAVSPNGVGGRPEATSRHGTHVAGVLVGDGSASPDGKDLSGIAPGADLVALDLSAQFTTSNALRAFEWIYENHEAHNIRVVSNSWGRSREAAEYDPIIRAANALVAQGIVVVFSSGNGGNQPGSMTLEATNPYVITVGAANDRGRVESYSSRGPVLDGGEGAEWVKPDLVAPGSRILSTRSDWTPGAEYFMMNGTSMAAPHVAGAAALLLSVRPELTPDQVRTILTTSARDVGPTGVDDESGFGLLDVRASIAALEAAGPQLRQQRSVTTRSGSLTGGSIANTLLTAASVDTEQRFAVRVPENATGLEAHVNWTGRSPLKVSLVAPTGSARHAEIARSAAVVLDQPLSGVWEVVLSPEGVGPGEYDVRIEVTWIELTEGRPLPLVSMEAQHGSFPFPGRQGPLGVELVPGVPAWMPFAGAAVVSTLFIVGAVRRRRD